jgi:hypothetical protein
VEDAFKVGKTCLGWEDVQLLAYEAVQLLVALGWVAAGFLFELGVTLASAEVRFLARLGGAPDRPDDRPGKIILTRGLRRLLDLFATEAIIQDEIRRDGSIPPRLAALIGRSPTGCVVYVSQALNADEREGGRRIAPSRSPAPRLNGRRTPPQGRPARPSAAMPGRLTARM